MIACVYDVAENDCMNVVNNLVFFCYILLLALIAQLTAKQVQKHALENCRMLKHAHLSMLIDLDAVHQDAAELIAWTCDKYRHAVI